MNQLVGEPREIQDSAVWPPVDETVVPPAQQEGFLTRHSKGIRRTVAAAGAAGLAAFGLVRGPALIDGYQHQGHESAAKTVSKVVGPLTQAMLEQIPDTTECPGYCVVGDYHNTNVPYGTAKYKVEVIVLEDGSGINFIGVRDDPSSGEAHADFSIMYATDGSNVLESIRNSGRKTYTKKDFKNILAEKTTRLASTHTTVESGRAESYSSIHVPDVGGTSIDDENIVVTTGLYGPKDVVETRKGEDFYYSRLDEAVGILANKGSLVIDFAQRAQNHR